EAADYDALVGRARRRFASLVEVPPDRVAVGNQVSTFTGLVAAALPDGARVLAAEEDFTSVLFPFLTHADRGVRVETVSLDRLVERIRPGVSLVAVRAVQSAGGRRVPDGLDALASAAAAQGCLTYIDAPASQFVYTDSESPTGKMIEPPDGRVKLRIGERRGTGAAADRREAPQPHRRSRLSLQCRVVLRAEFD